MGCGASSSSGAGASKAKYATSPPTPAGRPQSWAGAPEPRAAKSAHTESPGITPASSLRETPHSYRGIHRAGTDISEADSAAPCTAVSTDEGPPLLHEVPGRTTPRLEVQDFDASRGAEDPAASWDWCDASWWSTRAEWISQRSSEILAAYNFFFEHIGLRKGWRTAPFQQDEVQAPFLAAAEVVVLVRAKLDAERGGVLVLRQVEGSAMNFLWGWNPSRPPGASDQALEDFFRGLVFATLSDGRGLVEGLDPTTVESYVCRHPLLGASGGAGLDATSRTEADAAAVPVAACA